MASHRDVIEAFVCVCVCAVLVGLAAHSILAGCAVVWAFNAAVALYDVLRVSR